MSNAASAQRTNGADDRPGAGRTILLDVYGTLLDIGSPVSRLAEEVGPQAARLAGLWRSHQLERIWVATLTGRHETFWDATSHALATALEEVGITGDDGLREALLDAYRAPDLFGEVRPALAELRGAGWRLGVLTNAGEDMVRPVLECAGIADLLDPVISVEPLGLYKPHQKAYEHGLTRIGGRPQDIAFVSSNPWDIAGASTFGFAAVWLARGRPRLPYPVAHTPIPSLRGLPGRLAHAPLRPTEGSHP